MQKYAKKSSRWFHLEPEFVFAIDKKTSIEYMYTNENAIFNVKKIPDYDTVYFKSISNLNMVSNYSYYENYVNSLRECLYTFANEGSKVVDWLEQAIYEKVSIEYEKTNKILARCLKF